MIVSWNWLTDYVNLTMPHDELVDRLTMSGLNHEETRAVGKDQAIDLEVTSNRSDCLGHLGVAREIAALFDIPISIPDPQPATNGDAVEQHVSVEIKNPETCFRYTARLIRGVKIGPSPVWMQERLTTLGIGVVNNVVDATNYVMFECGQPLHAFDFAKIHDGKIIVRSAGDKETIAAIDHRTYQLSPGMCVIADANAPVALGGVMGGADSEVSDATTDVLIEAAYFDQLAVRKAARKLKLHSPSSFRFERDVDSANLDWASRRVCELILQTAGGELLEGVVDVGQPPCELAPVTLRMPQLKRLLGIEIPAEFVPTTLEKLGLAIKSADEHTVVTVPPSFRKDLTREVDLIEEVGRIFGFDKIPDNVNVPMAASHRPPIDRVVDKIRSIMTAAGFDEAVTVSLLPSAWSDAFSPWTTAPPLISSQPMLGVLDDYSQNIGTVNVLRRSIVPNLLEVARINEYRSNSDVSLFETAKVYLPQGSDEIPLQPTKLALVSQRDYFAVKGLLESLISGVSPHAQLTIEACEFELLDINKSCELKLDGQTLGWVGEVSATAKKQFGIRTNATVAELDIQTLEQLAVLVPQHTEQSQFQPMSRDFNFILDDSVPWIELEANVRAAGGPLLESVEYKETFRNEAKDGQGKKRVLLSVTLRSNTETLTGQQADQVSQAIINQCESKLSAALLG